MPSDPLIAIFCIVCLVYALRGAIFGLTKVVLRICALTSAYFCAYIGYQPVSAQISQHSPIELPVPLFQALAGCVCLLATFILFRIIAAGIHSIIKRLTAEWPTNFLRSVATRTLAALISCAFGFGLCLSGLVGYLMLSKVFALPTIEPTTINQGFIRLSENVLQRIQTDGIPNIQTDEPRPDHKPVDNIQAPSIRKSDGIVPINSLTPMSLISNANDSMLLQHTTSPQQKQALEQDLNHLLSQEGQLKNFIRQSLPADYQKKMGIDTILEQKDAEKRIAQQFRHLLNNRQALISALQALQEPSLPAVTDEQPIIDLRTSNSTAVEN